MQESRQSEPPKGVHATFLHLFRGFWQISAGQNATLGGPWRITHLIHTHIYIYIYILLFVYIYIYNVYIYIEIPVILMVDVGNKITNHQKQTQEYS